MTTSPLLRDLAPILAAGFVRVLVNKKKSEMGLACIGDVEAPGVGAVNPALRHSPTSNTARELAVLSATA